MFWKTRLDVGMTGDSYKTIVTYKESYAGVPADPSDIWTGLWRDANGKIQEIGLPEGAAGVLLTLQSKKKHQSTLDLRSDSELSRQLVLRTIVPLFLAPWPVWV